MGGRWVVPILTHDFSEFKLRTCGLQAQCSNHKLLAAPIDKRVLISIDGGILEIKINKKKQHRNVLPFKLKISKMSFFVLCKILRNFFCFKALCFLNLLHDAYILGQVKVLVTSKCTFAANKYVLVEVTNEITPCLTPCFLVRKLYAWLKPVCCYEQWLFRD